MTDLDETRTAYDVVAADYADLLRDRLADSPYERAVLGAFAELVPAGARVADVGCGPGRITTHLHDLGLDVFGVDLSPGMIAVARRDHPHIRFDVGSMTGLDLPDEALGGLVAWYSIIHTPPERRPAVFAELHRVLAPGSPLLLAFQVGDERVHIQEGYGHSVSLHAYRLDPDRIAAELAEAGLPVHARLIEEQQPAAKTPQAYVVARKPA
jgi:SAM-dependent methyltransferase